MSELNRHVARRFHLAVSMSVLAKLSVCILQIVSIPIAVKTLGVSGYASFAALFALSLAPQALILRHGPVLAGPIAALYAGNKWEEIAGRMWAAFVASVITMVFSVLVCLCLFAFGGMEKPIASETFSPLEVTVAFVCLTAMSVLSPLLLVFEDAQSALHESHLQGIRIGIGNALAIVAILCILPACPTLVGYVLCLTFPPFVIRLANVGFFLHRYPAIQFKQRRHCSDSVKAAMRGGALFTAVIGVGAFASNQVPVLAAATYLDAHQTASVSVVQQLVLVAFAFGSVVVTAFLPAFNTSVSVGNLIWASDWLYRLEKLFAFVGIVAVVGFMLIGGFLHDFLLGVPMSMPKESLLFAGIYSVLTILENFYFLLASSIHLSRRIAALFIIRAGLTGLVALIACIIGYPPMIWMFAALFASLVTIVPYRSVVWEQLSQQRSGALSKSLSNGEPSGSGSCGAL